MRVVIAGSREITDGGLVERALSEAGWPWDVTEVVSGGARGVDRLGENWASERSIPVTRFPADWDRYGRSAGVLRNREMAVYADALLAIWDGKSRGTKNMIEQAQRAGLVIHVYNLSTVSSSDD